MTCASCVMRVEKALERCRASRTPRQPGHRDRPACRPTRRSRPMRWPRRCARPATTSRSTDVTLQVEGMTCASCVGRVEKALLKVPGVLSAPPSTWPPSAPACRRCRPCPSAPRGRGREGRLQRPKRVAAASQRRRRAGPHWWPVALGAALTLPLVAPMLLQLFGIALDADRLAAAGAGHAGAVLARRALLPRRLEGAARRHRQHGPAGGARHLGGLRPVSVYLLFAHAGHGMPHLYFEASAVGHHAGAAGQVAGGARQAPDHRGHPRAERAAPDDRARAAATAPSVEVPVARGARRRPRGGAPRRAHAGRRRGRRGPQPRRRIADHRREPAGGQGTPGDRVTGGAVNAEGLLLVRTTARRRRDDAGAHHPHGRVGAGQRRRRSSAWSTASARSSCRWCSASRCSRCWAGASATGDWERRSSTPSRCW